MSTSEDSKSFEQAIRDAERKSVMAVVAPALRNATDLLSEQLANSDDEHAKYLLKVNRALWQARWSGGQRRDRSGRPIMSTPVDASDRTEDARNGARHIVQNGMARSLVGEFLDWDGGPHIGVSALCRIARELRMISHYLQSSGESETAAELAGSQLQNIAEFADAAATLAEAEAESKTGGAS